ncbi:hypothetical protein LWI28_001373 [Acer negundo]|uniref:Xylanase inhibitor N-terminal domain-containing protein n=1 Tax=Acer negundo TaxID=4023 RepID=A0AAD5IL05_ACENE|nr:hypothetical protein LWI28_001373 [Acer negundo]KAK4842758.1 hypothetical protein QYF36_027235 [Acer negundo]
MPMVVEVMATAGEVERTRMVAVNTRISLGTIIQGTTITVGEGEACHEKLAREDLVEDTVVVEPVDVDRFLLACAPSFLLQGLASGAKGMLGLGRIRLSLLSQLAASVE